MKYSLILIAAMAAGPLCAAPPEDPRPPGAAQKAAIEKAVLEADDRATSAGSALDAAKLIDCLAENDKGSVVMNGAILLTRQDARENVTASFRRVTSVEYKWSRRLVTVLSPEAAVVVSEGESTASTQSGAFSQPFVQTAVWVLRGGQWKILHAHQSSSRR